MKLKSGYLLIGALAGYAGYKIFIEKNQNGESIASKQNANKEIFIGPINEPSATKSENDNIPKKGIDIGSLPSGIAKTAALAGFITGAIYVADRAVAMGKGFKERFKEEFLIN